MRKIAIIGSKATLGGSEMKIYNIAKNMDKSIFNLDVIFLYEEGPISCQLRKENINTYVLDLNKNGYKKSIKNLKKIMKENKYELVYAFGYKVNFIIRALHYLGVKTKIYTAAESTGENKKKIENIVDKLTSSLVTNYICISNSVKESLINRDSIDTKKIKLIYNGIDCSKFKKIYTKQECIDYVGTKFLKKDDIIIGTVGNLRKAKGHIYLIKAIKVLKDKGYKNIKCVLVGDGDLREELEVMVRHLKIENNVLFLGSRSDIDHIIPIFDIFVMPSLWEGFGLAAVEAMVAKIPVIASDVDGLKEVLDDNITGILFEKCNENSLSDKIELLLNNQNLKDEIVKNAYYKAINKFDIIDKVKELEILISKDLEERQQ